ncbi:MAG: general secretion pathway protein GspD [Candidatus Anammoximicrobium sp.]|nr:general secretion pathway protein GspD [Candidatus Anammoximicrobium sp.]
MKATACYIVGCLAVWFVLPGTPGQAAHPLVTGMLAAAESVLAQAGPAAASRDRQEVDRLLQETRQAMNRGDLEAAQRLLSKAERLPVQYDPLYERFQDTPAKVRRALQDLQAGRSPDERSRPSDRFAPALHGRGLSSPAPLPAGTAPSRDAAQALDTLTDDAKAKAKTYAEKGRLALQQGDLAGATAWCQKAIALNASFELGEYSPAALADELRRAGVAPERLVAASPSSLGPATPKPEDFAPGRETSLPQPLPASGLTPTSYDQPLAAEMPGEPRRLPSLPPASLAAREEALRLLALSRSALDRGDAAGAKQLAEQARALRVPDEAFGPNEPRPEHLLMEIQSALNRRAPTLAAAPSGVVPAYDPGTSSRDPYPVRQGLYDPAQDRSRTQPAQALGVPVAAGSPAPGAARPTVAGQGPELYRQGLLALERQDRATALQLFSEAWKREAELDPATRQSLRDKLTLLRVAASAAPAVGTPGSAIEEVDAEQRLLRDKLFRDITREQSVAEKMRQTDPRGSLTRLQRLREQVEQDTLDPTLRRQMLNLVDRSIRETEGYIVQNLADIELQEHNRSANEDIERSQQNKLDKQNKLAELVEQFNNLIDDQRFSEAEVIAKQAHELEPDSEVVRSMLLTSKFAWRVQEQNTIQDDKERGFYDAMASVDKAGIPFGDDGLPLRFGDAKDWNQLSRTRGDWLREQRSRLTPAEMEIQKALKTEVDVKFENRPLSEVVETLGRMAGVNVFLDQQGLHAEGITTDEPVNINLTQPISLRSALNLILEPLHLSYVIQNEVLRVTSEQTRDANVYPRVYNVADLVIPIPNFMPSYNIGLPGAIKEAMNATGLTRTTGLQQTVPLTLASSDAAQQAASNASVLAQMSSSGMLPGVTSRSPQPLGYAPGGMGGASMADFDTLIDLITTTIAPQSWDTVGGPGSIEGFPTNLSLVVSQTQEVHEQIADLLDQLRRLQDLQVTIEVRFITLNDSFYERIGIDFDFEVDDNSAQIAGQNSILPDDTGPSMAFGLDPTGTPTADFDYAFAQDMFTSAVPQFGGFDSASAANFGFAILSDIEVFFLLQAAQGDDRTNVLQAPKVTLFNGQTGLVMDNSQRPFVTSVIPVVGDFAAAHQPVVVVLNEGTSLSVQAVVSPDRRFVRLTLVPFFSSIGDVDTFTFNGRVSSDSGTTVADPTNEASSVTNNRQNFVEGTTVQLPTFNFTTVSTTVSVPDGGTVLLGGIKRLSEGRNERGVPMLSKIPYINRLFRNVGIGRDAQSLMMMVTPRIIIQEEEEFLQTGYDSSQQ